MGKRWWWVSLLLALLAACSTPHLQPIGQGGKVDVVVILGSPASGVIRIHNDALAKDTGTGVASGMLAGGLWGLSCGPLAILCVPLGMVSGSVLGTATGAAVGLTGALSSDKAALLRGRVAQVQGARPLLLDLQTQVAERARRHWTLGADPSATQVTIELQDLVLGTTRDERVRCVVLARVQVRAGTGGGLIQEKLYQYASPFGSLAAWMDDGSDFADTSFSNASRQLAAQIVADLALP